MLIKSWVRELDRGLRVISIPEQRAKTREFRYLGMERWKLTEMVGILPLLIQISLFCLPSVSSYFFFTSVNPRLMSPQQFLELESSIMPLPRPYNPLQSMVIFKRGRNQDSNFSQKQPADKGDCNGLYLQTEKPIRQEKTKTSVQTHKESIHKNHSLIISM